VGALRSEEGVALLHRCLALGPGPLDDEHHRGLQAHPSEVGRLLAAEAGVLEERERELGQAQARLGDQDAREDQLGGRGVLAELGDEHLHHAAQLGGPGAGRRRRDHICEEGVAHRGEELVLVGDVPVERHRGDPELLGDPADRDRVGALGIHHGQRALDDSGPVQVALGGGCGGGSGGHEQNYTR